MPSGGRRPGAGRPKHNPPLKKRKVSLTDDQVKLLRQWGKGDMSAGLRWLIDVAATMVKKVEKNENRG